jgi:hypothetical protein
MCLEELQDRTFDLSMLDLGGPDVRAGTFRHRFVCGPKLKNVSLHKRVLLRIQNQSSTNSLEIARLGNKYISAWLPSLCAGTVNHRLIHHAQPVARCLNDILGQSFLKRLMASEVSQERRAKRRNRPKFSDGTSYRARHWFSAIRGALALLANSLGSSYTFLKSRQIWIGN